jgi:hypothetical protein
LASSSKMIFYRNLGFRRSKTYNSSAIISFACRISLSNTTTDCDKKRLLDGTIAA